MLHQAVEIAEVEVEPRQSVGRVGAKREIPIHPGLAAALDAVDLLLRPRRPPHVEQRFCQPRELAAGKIGVVVKGAERIGAVTGGEELDKQAVVKARPGRRHEVLVPRIELAFRCRAVLINLRLVGLGSAQQFGAGPAGLDEHDPMVFAAAHAPWIVGARIGDAALLAGEIPEQRFDLGLRRRCQPMGDAAVGTKQPGNSVQHRGGQEMKRIGLVFEDTVGVLMRIAGRRRNEVDSALHLVIGFANLGLASVQGQRAQRKRQFAPDAAGLGGQRQGACAPRERRCDLRRQHPVASNVEAIADFRKLLRRHARGSRVAGSDYENDAQCGSPRELPIRLHHRVPAFRLRAEAQRPSRPLLILCKRFGKPPLRAVNAARR